MTATEKTGAPRTTKQRTAIAEMLAASDEFQSAQELHDRLKADGQSIGLTTVYRNLQALADADQVDVLVTDSGESRYRRCSSGHHHHLVCRDCGTTVEVQADTVETWAAEVAQANGFDQVSHTVEVFGRCRACRAA
ncbi:Fur family transcriptional regulator [Jongsikchunia kroppenstedtii]|uniref:Fur family transcriptional regulator n=1 Tax=Jongsikchunia kroppenstedtii TaxID=1121721 RepID=UPI00036786C1|nr:Fur family transcriptional regulator [Jongsikchunia kroppenstedtii]